MADTMRDAEARAMSDRLRRERAAADVVRGVDLLVELLEAIGPAVASPDGFVATVEGSIHLDDLHRHAVALGEAVAEAIHLGVLCRR